MGIIQGSYGAYACSRMAANMVPTKSLDVGYTVIAAMLRDVFKWTYGPSFIEQCTCELVQPDAIGGARKVSYRVRGVCAGFAHQVLYSDLIGPPGPATSDGEYIVYFNEKQYNDWHDALRLSARNLDLTLKSVEKRLESEGIGFLTKTLPRLGKALDRALSTEHAIDFADVGVESISGMNLPRFLGELFSRVLNIDGVVLPSPCVLSVRVIRQITYLFYKYELPYSHEQEQHVVSRFERTEDDLISSDRFTSNTVKTDPNNHRPWTSGPEKGLDQAGMIRKARKLLWDVFSSFDPRDITPAHGPGAVATRQQPWEKYVWTNIAKNITDYYPLDRYFCASKGHVCDCYKEFDSLGEVNHSARVVLVPKDSRGPRLISCEPVDFQWIQQGLSKAIVRLVENSELTKFNVFFTDQGPNQRGAWLGSKLGSYATLDLNEASDRVSLVLVKTLFPAHLYDAMVACRSSSTMLPDGRELILRKFAPMGSSLCFPILALTIWSLLMAGAPDTDTRESILVYGDDVIVPTAYAKDAMSILESFGLKINHDKSCTSGFFRESCGYDAFKGESVTPVRLRTVWSSARRADVYTSYIAYANSLFERGYVECAEQLAKWLVAIYGAIPSTDMKLHAPSLTFIPYELQKRMRYKRRVNPFLQKVEYFVLDVLSPVVRRTLPGWSMLLRYFAESAATADGESNVVHHSSQSFVQPTSTCASITPSGVKIIRSVSLYTERRSSILKRRWR